MGYFQMPNGIDIVSVRRQIADEFRKAQRDAKPTECILCGQRKTSFCNSHSIPQMVLRNIAEKGRVLEANALIGFEILDIGKGVNNSGTFYFICNDCDSKYFQDYENPENLLHRPTDRMMAEIALKDTLIQLYKRRIELKLFDSLQEKTGGYENFELLRQIKQLDIDEYNEEISFYKRIIVENM